MKIKITYQDEQEKNIVLQLLNPILRGAKVRNNQSQDGYNHVYIALKNQENTTK